MIVRILGEGQFDVDADTAAHLEELDNKLVAAVESDDEAAFDAALAAILEDTRRLGHAVPPGRFAPSDMALPQAGTSLAELKAILASSDVAPEIEKDGAIPRAGA
jgi:hypothetical protein